MQDSSDIEEQDVNLKAKKNRLIRNVTEEKLGGANNCRIQKVRRKKGQLN